MMTGKRKIVIHKIKIERVKEKKSNELDRANKKNAWEYLEKMIEQKCPLC